MWNFEIKDLRDYSCDSKNSKRFWNFSEDPRDVFLFFDFGRRNCTNHLVEVFVFLDLRRENFNFLKSKISETTHAISKIPKDSETSAKMLDRFFLFLDFDWRNPTNEFNEVFDFLVRAHELSCKTCVYHWFHRILPIGWDYFESLNQSQLFSSSARESMDGLRWLSIFCEFPNV